MIRPDSVKAYDELDLKLGIKSSLPHVKATLGLLLLLFETQDCPHTVQYSVSSGDELRIADDVFSAIYDKLLHICQEAQISRDDLLGAINSNQLLKSQLEALIVSFELVWKLAKVDFVDADKPASAERTGGKRYPKYLSYTVNADIVHGVIASNLNEYLKVLLAWVGVNVVCNSEYERILLVVLTAISENAMFKLTDGQQDKVFNQNSIYAKLLEGHQTVDINGDKEAKGSLRILKSALSDGLNPYLAYSSGIVRSACVDEVLTNYQKRVETYLRLSATKVIGLEDMDADTDGIDVDDPESIRIPGGQNTLLYGVPGAGKSWTIAREYCSDETRMERLVFHPDYTYSDFVGQIMPKVEDGSVSYRFVPGPFTKLLKKAYEHPETEYFLIIEEINRGNAPAIFGEVFQLLDRKAEPDESGYPVGTSEYGITNENVASIVYGDPDRLVRIPSNMSIIGTMNTSDQNVFTLDTAFQRRWNMRLIENTFEGHRFADNHILDTDVSWRQFCEAINREILKSNVRMTSSEDKRLGAFFITAADLVFNANEDDDNAAEAVRIRARRDNRRFAEKVIKYLWDDAFKFNRENVFETNSFISLEQLIREFMDRRGNDRFRIFKEGMFNAIVDQVDGTTIQ